MKNIKVERAVYAAWDYELELEHLNKMSEKGWQLIHGGCFHMKYERNENVVYRYQLDHNMKIENRMRYIDTYREQGWEYINSTFNGWHYFRKVYDPEKPAEEYEIYSDRPSKEEMVGRLGKQMLVLSVIVAVTLAAQIALMVVNPRMSQLGIIGELVAVLALTVTGFVRMGKVGRGETVGKKFPFGAFIAAVLVCFVWSMVFAVGNDTMETAVQSSAGTAVIELELKLPDWIEVDLGNEEGARLTLSDQKGDVREIGEGHLFLMPGRYVLDAQYQEVNSVAVNVD